MQAAGLTAAEAAASKAAFQELGLCDELCDAAANMRWKAPSEIQKEAIPPLLEGVLCTAKTAVWLPHTDQSCTFVSS